MMKLFKDLKRKIFGSDEEYETIKTRLSWGFLIIMIFCVILLIWLF